MKVYNQIGSKERFLEMFQRVNKVNLNENFNGGNVDTNSILTNGFQALKNGQLSIQGGGSNNTTVQMTDNESTIEINGVDSNKNNYKFVFNLTYNEGDQDGVYNVDTVTLISFEYRSSDGSQTFELDKEGLINFNQQYGGDLFDIVEKFVDVKSPNSDIDIDELEEAVKLIDAIKQDSYPFGGETNRMQTGKAYADEKPTNPALRVKSPQLDKVLNEEDGEKKEKGDYPDQMGKKFKPKKHYPSKKKKSQSVVKINESTDRDKYENVVFLQGDEAFEPLERLNNQGEDAALEYLKQWHSPGQHEGTAELSHGSSDKTYEKDGYILSWNPRLSYIGLQYDLSQLNENDDYVDDNQADDTYNPDELPPEYDGNFNFDDDEVDVTNPEPEISDDYTEEDEKFTMQAYDNLMKLNGRKPNYSPTSFEIQKEIEKLKGIVPVKSDNDSFKKSVYNKYLGVNEGDSLDGGLGDDKSPAEFDPKQIQLGIGVEMEHTTDPKVAMEIVLDHLTEDPQYYTVKDDPEASAQFNASTEANDDVPHESGAYLQDGMPGERDRNGHPIPAIDPNFSKMRDMDMTDLLLGYKPKNVGDVDEEFVGANGATGVVGDGGNYDYAAQERNYVDDSAYSRYQELQQKDFNNLADDEKEEFFGLWKQFKDNKAQPKNNNEIGVDSINESLIKKARQAINNRGIVDGMTKKEAVQILIKHNIR